MVPELLREILRLKMRLSERFKTRKIIGKGAEWAGIKDGLDLSKESREFLVD